VEEKIKRLTRSINYVLTVPGAHESHGAQANDMSPLYCVDSNSIQKMQTPARKFDLCLHFGIEESHQIQHEVEELSNEEAIPGNGLVRGGA